MNAWPPRTLEMLALRALGEETTGFITEWAVGALVAEFDTPTLRKLAGFATDTNPQWSRVESSLEATLSELGVPAFELKELLLLYLDELVFELASNRAPVAHTLDIIHSRVVWPLNHDASVKPWCLLWEGRDPETFEEIDDEGIRRFARRWLEERGASAGR